VGGRTDTANRLIENHSIQHTVWEEARAWWLLTRVTLVRRSRGQIEAVLLKRRSGGSGLKKGALPPFSLFAPMLGDFGFDVFVNKCADGP